MDYPLDIINKNKMAESECLILKFDKSSKLTPFVKKLEIAGELSKNFQAAVDSGDSKCNFYVSVPTQIFCEKENEFIIAFVITTGHSLIEYDAVDNAAMLESQKCRVIRLTRFANYLYPLLLDPVDQTKSRHLDVSLWAILANKKICTSSLELANPDEIKPKEAIAYGFCPDKVHPINGKIQRYIAPWLKARHDLQSTTNKMLNSVQGKYCKAAGSITAAKDHVISFDGSSIMGMSGMPLIIDSKGKPKVCGFLLGTKVHEALYETTLMRELLNIIAEEDFFCDPLVKTVYSELQEKVIKNNLDFHQVKINWENKLYDGIEGALSGLAKKIIDENQKYPDKNPIHNIYLSVHHPRVKQFYEKCMKFHHEYFGKKSLESAENAKFYFNDLMRLKIILYWNKSSSINLEGINFEMHGSDYSFIPQPSSNYSDLNYFYFSNGILNLNSIQKDSSIIVDIKDKNKCKIGEFTKIRIQFLGRYQCCYADYPNGFLYICINNDYNFAVKSQTAMTIALK